MKWVLCFFFIFSAWSIAQEKKPEVSTWSKRMQDSYKILADLLTDVTSDSRFADPSNRSRIEKEASKLSELAHLLNQNASAQEVDPDPSMGLFSGLLAQEARRAVVALKRNQREYARSLLRTLPSYCIACHTRNASGPQFSKLPFEPSSASLTPFDRGRFFTASRQFDRAQQEFFKVLENPQPQAGYSLDWRNAVREALSIAVRVKKDPDQAEHVVQLVLRRKEAPLFLKADAQVWLDSIRKWKQEGGKKPNTPEEFRLETLRLMDQAKAIQRYPMDRTADVVYLRASASAHDFLQVALQTDHLDEGLLLAGISYEVLNPLKTGELHELYYEACIRKSPHQAIAVDCYRRYEQSIFFGYTGSAGTGLPEDVRNKLKELKNLADPEIGLGDKGPFKLKP